MQNGRNSWVERLPVNNDTNAVMGAIKAARRVLVFQLLVTLSAVAVAGLVAGSGAALSAGVGGGISVVVTAVFAGLTFAAGPGATAARVARALYLGEVVKFLLTIALFAVAFVLIEVSFLPLILTYAATLMVYWLALLLTLDAR